MHSACGYGHARRSGRAPKLAIGQRDGRVAWTLAPAWLQLFFRGAGAGEVMPSEAVGDEEGEFRLKPS